MGDNVWINADRSAVVDETEPGKKFQMRRKEAIRLGLLPDGERVPQARRTYATHTVSEPREDTTRTFSTTGPAPETTERPKVRRRRAVKK